MDQIISLTVELVDSQGGLYGPSINKAVEKERKPRSERKKGTSDKSDEIKDEPSLDDVLGPGRDVKDPGAKERNIERDKPYEEVVKGILDLPGAKKKGTYETKWGEGQVIGLPDGTKISARPGSQKTGSPTIEVTDKDGVTEKNRFPDLDKDNNEKSKNEHETNDENK